MAWAGGALAEGDRLGPYEILAPLGPGVIGAAFQARDTRDERNVRIEVSTHPFPPGFDDEARALGELNHPRIARLYEAGPNYVVLESIEGVPLKGPLSLQETLRFSGEICDALEYAHRRGVIHGDLRPSNVVVTQMGVKLAGVGLARIAGAAAAISTPVCTPPEQRAEQAADARSDVYAVGCVLHEMLMGRPPGDRRRPVQPAALERVLEKCLTDLPEQRWQSAGELKLALAEVSKGGGYRREYIIAAASVVMLLAGMALLVMQFPSTQKLSANEVLVLGDFSNSTGDAIFDGTLRTALGIQLEQSGFIKILNEDRVQADLKLMGRAPDTRITNAIARDICVRERQKAMITGAIADLGNAFAIAIQAVNCRSGATLARDQAQAQQREQVLNSIAKAAIGIRVKLGESPNSIPSKELGRLTDTSLETLQAYARGIAQQKAGNTPAAIALFRHASELDPNFAIARLGLGRAWAKTGETAKARRAYEDFFELWKKVGADLPLLAQAQHEFAALN